MIQWIDHVLSLTGGDGLDPSKGPIVLGHRDMPGAATQCPGFDAGAWWASVVEARQLEPLAPAFEEIPRVRHPILEAIEILMAWLRGGPGK